MADVTFREEQWRRRYEEHIAPINRLVDALKSPGDRWLPYVAPMYGGVHARLLSLLRDPGPKTRADSGSGFLCMENDDPTAAAISEHFEAVGIDAQDIVPWNVYPWYINRDPTASELDEGKEPLNALIALLPRLRVVMLHGGSAREGWKRFTRTYPHIVDARGLHVIGTHHTARRTFIHRDPAVRQRRRAELREAFVQAANILSR